MHHDLLWIGAAKDPGETGVLGALFFFFTWKKNSKPSHFFFVWGGGLFRWKGEMRIYFEQTCQILGDGFKHLFVVPPNICGRFTHS